MTGNPVKAALAQGQAVVGTMLGEMLSPGTCRIVREGGYDFVIFDTEHHWPSLDAVVWLRAACEIGCRPTCARPASAGQWPARYLDLGAEGLIFPHVETAEQAQGLVEQVRVSADGQARGLGTNIAHDDYAARPAAEFTAERNANTLVAVQIETALGLANRDEILAVPGIDTLFIGPNDLALSMGLPGQLDHPDVVGAIEAIFASAQAAGVAPGMHCFDVEMALKYLDAGCRFMCFASQVSLFIRGSRAALATLRAREDVSGGVYA